MRPISAVTTAIIATNMDLPAEYRSSVLLRSDATCAAELSFVRQTMRSRAWAC